METGLWSISDLEKYGHLKDKDITPWIEFKEYGKDAIADFGLILRDCKKLTHQDIISSA